MKFLLFSATLIAFSGAGHAQQPPADAVDLVRNELTFVVNPSADLALSQEVSFEDDNCTITVRQIRESEEPSFEMIETIDANISNILLNRLFIDATGSVNEGLLHFRAAGAPYFNADYPALLVAMPMAAEHLHQPTFPK